MWLVREARSHEYNYDTKREELLDLSGDGGRPTVMTKDSVQKLETAFAWGYNDVEAAIYAGVARGTVHNYANKYPSFLDRKEQLKNQLNMKAKSNVAKKIKEGDKELSKWWLERRNKEEFSLRTEMTGANGGSIENKTVVVTQEELDKAKQDIMQIEGE